MFTMSHHFVRAVIVAAALFAAGSVPAADAVRYMPVPNSSKLRMDGTSTIHDWHADTDIIGGFMELEATFADGKSVPIAVSEVVSMGVFW